MSRTYKDSRLLTKRLENKFFKKLKAFKRSKRLGYDSYLFDVDESYQHYEEPGDRYMEYITSRRDSL